MATLQKAFPRDTLPIWSDYDYSDPRTTIVGNGKPGDVIKILEARFPGLKVKWEDGTVGWVCEWDVLVEGRRYNSYDPLFRLWYSVKARG